MSRTTSIALAALLAGCSSASSSTARAPSPGSAADGAVPDVALIRESDIKSDLFTLASDAMRGREAGTLDELRASGWIVERLRAAGVLPAGEDDTYYQWFPLRRTRESSSSRLAIDGQPLTLWQDYMLNGRSEADIDAPIVWLGDSGTMDTLNAAVSGKVAAVLLNSAGTAPPAQQALAARRFVGAAAGRVARPLLARGALAVLVVADGPADALFDLGATQSNRGTFTVDVDDAVSRGRGRGQGGGGRGGQGGGRGGRGGAGGGGGDQPVLVLRNAWLSRVSAGRQLEARLTVDEFTYPSVNIIARVTGTDPALRNEYVLFSAHQDHDGVRAPIDGDSIWNGADDNASVAVGVLAIARAWVRHPGRRSALFVWHGSEEKGLLGSRWHAAHPVVPRSSIVAVLNGDMIGRNSPDTAALMGSIPPHRNSTDLVRMAIDANNRVSHFAIDSSWDRPTHPEGWYFRSDHLPYARDSIPALFYSSNLHPDYHTPRDGPERIDISKLTRIARWMYATGWTVANTNQRPRLDDGFRLER